MPSIDRADHEAGRLPILGREMLIVDPVDAQGALLHDTVVVIELARAVGACPGTELAADADRLIDQHDAVFGPLVGSAGRTHGDAVRLLAMQTGFWKVNGSRAFALAFLERMDAVEPHAPGAVGIGAEIGQRSHMTARVPFLAGRRAGVAADANVEIDD